MYMQDLAGVAHDDIDPSVFSIRGDGLTVSSRTLQNSKGRQLLSCLFIGSKNHL